MATELVSRNKFNYFEKITQIFTVYLIAVQPMLWNKSGYSAITEFKFKAFWIPSVVYGAIMLVLFVYSLFDKDKTFYQRQKEAETEVTVAQIFAFAFAMWNVISALKSQYGKHTWIGMGRFEGVASALLYSGVFILISFWGEFTKWFQRCISCFAAVFSFIAVLQLFYDGIIHPEGYNYWSVLFMSTLGNIDCVGGICAMVVPVLFCTYVFTEDKPWNYIALGFMGLMMFLMILTDVDSGKVGITVGLIAAFPFMFQNKKTTVRAFEAFAVLFLAIFLVKFLGLRSDRKFHIAFGKKQLLFMLASAVMYGASWAVKLCRIDLGFTKEKAIKITLIVLGAIFVFALIFVFTYKGDVALIKEASQVLHGNLTDDAGSGRGYIWKTSWWLAKKTPMFGTGPGTFVATYYPYDILETTTDFAHNDFLQVAVCTGLVGLALYVFFIISLAYRAFSRAGKCSLIVVFGAGCAGYLAHSFFSFSIAIMTPMFWALAGITDHLVRQVDLASLKSKAKDSKKN